MKSTTVEMDSHTYIRLSIVYHKISNSLALEPNRNNPVGISAQEEIRKKKKAISTDVVLTYTLFFIAFCIFSVQARPAVAKGVIVGFSHIGIMRLC